MISVIYFASTPLNLLLSATLASVNQQTEKASLFLIDQRSDAMMNYYLPLLQAWPDNPFQHIKVYKAQAKGWAKLAERKQTLQQIKTDALNVRPHKVMTGSDRRIEFQYAMHCLQQADTPAQGVYVDDGLYTYIGRPEKPKIERLMAWLKQMYYGRWWSEAKQLGTSQWIQSAYCFQPQHAISALSHLPKHKIQSDWFQRMPLISLADLALDDLSLQIARLQVVVLVSHPDNVARIAGYQQRIQAQVAQLVQQGCIVGVKYHPRWAQADELQLQQQGAQLLLPSMMAFELLLLRLPVGIRIIGDVGTGLLTARWFRQDSQVTAMLDGQDTFQARLLPLMKRFDVEVVNVEF